MKNDLKIYKQLSKKLERDDTQLIAKCRVMYNAYGDY